MSILTVCKVCKGNVEERRSAIHLDLCFKCGDKEAKDALSLKSKNVTQVYSKGPYMFMGGKSAKQNALDAGRKTSADYSDFVADVAAPAKTTGRVKKKIVGTMWYADRTSRAIYEGEDLAKLNPVRYVFFGDKR